MLLLYCVTESVADAHIPGVHGSPVSTIAEGGVLCHSSEWSERNKDDAQQDALAYWSVVNRLFQQTAVIPFRFPTFMKDQAAMQEFLALNAQGFLSELRRLRDLVQMRITIPSEPTSNAAPPTSGTEFLKQRQKSSRVSQDTIAALRASGEDLVREWKQSHRTGSTLLFALIGRGALEDLKSRISQIEASANVRVSGPWPPSEFIKCELELPMSTETTL
ncbi:MAG: Gas vesicle synthesis GvpLGvpF [Acidobacteriales bacterium]|nr:Gas vesicle synthesis GvpLGvpF [Terriglobales bacterium]